jgi:hypothetical protein
MVGRALGSGFAQLSSCQGAIKVLRVATSTGEVHAIRLKLVYGATLAQNSAGAKVLLCRLKPSLQRHLQHRLQRHHSLALRLQPTRPLAHRRFL